MGLRVPRPGADEDRQAGVLAARKNLRTMDLGRHVVLGDSRPAGIDARPKSRLRRPRRLAHVLKLPRRLDETTFLDEARAVDEGSRGQRGDEALLVAGAQKERVVVEPDAALGETQVGEHVPGVGDPVLEILVGTAVLHPG